MLKSIKFTLILMGLVLLFSHCDEREWNSPYDSAMDPELWVPSNLKIAKNTLTSALVSWSASSYDYSGYKIDRKKENEQWEIGFADLPSSSTSFTDYDIIPDINTSYYYRVYAFAGENNSSSIERQYNPEFPAPIIRGISSYSATRIKINWEYAEYEVESYHLTYKNNLGEWKILENDIPSARHYCFDNNFDKNTKISYRVYAKYKGLTSEYAEVDVANAL